MTESTPPATRLPRQRTVQQATSREELTSVDPAASAAGGAPPEGAVLSTRHVHLVIRASAGSGKTYQLAIRYLRKLLDGVPPDQILASTFTRKAAGEILARILTRLARAGRDEDSLRQLAVHLGEPQLTQSRCLELLQQLSHSLNRLKVGTLDSFFSRLATSYTLELGLPPGWQIIDELADAKLRRQAVEAVLNATSTADIRRLTSLLSKAENGRRVSTLLQETVDEFYDIYLRTDHAAWHPRPRTKMLNREELSAAIEQLHGVELPAHKTIQKQREKDCADALAEDWATFCRNGIAACLATGKSTYYGKEIPPAAAAVYQRLLDHARGCILQRLLARTAAVYEILLAFDKVYISLKHRDGGLRFDDVTRRLAQAFGTDGDAYRALGQLAYRLDSEIAHLLLDEFQDTSLPQWQVIRPFAERIVHAPSDTSLFAVGDVKQAIYGWRGGVAEIFDAIDCELKEVSSATLAASFRSSQAVIDAVNQLCSGLTRHPKLEEDEQTICEWCRKIEPHTTQRDLPGYVTLETGPAAEEEDPSSCADLLIAAAADRVKQITSSAPWATVGVLVRQNRYIAPLIAALKDCEVDASEESGNPLTDSAAVLLMMSILKLADHPGDTIARFHLATSPVAKVFDFTDYRDDQRAAALSAELRRQLLDEGYGPTLDAWAREMVACCSRRDVTRLGQLVELAYRHQEQATLRPKDFIRLVEAERVQDPSSARVRVMTVHQAKGLQFDAVVLLLLDHSLVCTPPKYFAGGHPTSPPDLVSVYASKDEQPLLPPRFQDAARQSRAAKIRDELCVLYVAVTRAIHALHMFVPPSPDNEKSLRRNCAGLVRAALTDGGRAEPSSLLYEHGQRDWAAAAGTDRDRAAPPSATSSASITAVKLAPMADGRLRGLGRVAPSRGAAARSLRISHLAATAGAAALERGTLFHAWFEQVAWLDAGAPDEELLRQIARRHGFDEEQTSRHLASFRSMLAQPDIERILSQQSYLSHQEPPLSAALRAELGAGPVALELARERRVVVQLEGELLTGAIDRLILLRTAGRVVAADIIDYKTDAVATGDAAQLQRAGHYREQLTAYRDAIGRIYRLHLERITARLLFVQNDQILQV